MKNYLKNHPDWVIVFALAGPLWSCQQSQLKGEPQSPAPEINLEDKDQNSKRAPDSKASGVKPNQPDPLPDPVPAKPATAAPLPSAPVVVTTPEAPVPLPTPQPTPPAPTPPAPQTPLVPAAPLPTPSTLASPTLEACTPDRPPTQAYVHVTVTMFSNMEHGFHVIEEGAIFQLVQNGKVVIAGLATMEAVRNGRPTDGNGAYPGRVLRLEATYAPQPSSGSGTIFMCQGALGVPPQSATCQNQPSFTARDPGRPVEVRGQAVQWTVSGGAKLGLVAGDSVPDIAVKGGNFNVSAYHPVFAAAAPGAAFKDFQSPLVLDLNNNGQFDLIDVWDEAYQVRFDLKGDGRRGRTGWVGPGDGLLGLDVNQNGTIDSGEELFGEYSVGSTLRGSGKLFENGFLALSQFDSNNDRQIDQSDSIFSRLLVWQDLNSDGFSHPSELKSLGELKIKSISLKYIGMKPGYERFIKNNEVRLLGSYKTEDGKVHGLSDVWFKQRRYTDGQLVQSGN